MRRATLLFVLSLVLGVLLLAGGGLWRGAAPSRVLAGVPVPAGLLTETPTELPRPTATPLPADTATATPITTATVTPTPTECRIYFVDVPPDNTFYDTIRCLSCRGIVSGYPCGGPGEPCPGQYYRPGNNVTRGQTSKIMSLAAGFAEPVPSTQQAFEDVPPGSTFWAYIERLASRGIVAGYPCGGPGEPCVGPGNRPYFRPNNNVTRGQLAKIVSGAAQYTETPTGQTFADVPPGSTFYLYVERIATRGIVGGYPCGGPGEPCPGTYYRPNNNATRGQMAKIAANAFYPNCDSPGPSPTPTHTATATPPAPTPTAPSATSPTATPPAPTATPPAPTPTAPPGTSPTATHTAGPTSTPCGTWSIVPSPNVPMSNNALLGVAVVSATDVWAVGTIYTDYPPTWQTLVEHWNGTTWSIVPSPNPGPVESELLRVAAVSATDVWAVGLGSDEHTFPVPPLVEHWDGTTWSIVPSPSAGPDYNIFVDVEAIGPNNVWAVGFYGGYGSPNSRALVEHWDGTSWSVVPHPAETVTSSFSAVAAVGPDDVWAIGFYDNGGPTHTLMEHWNGTDWSVVLAPELGVGSRSYMDMAAVSATDIWAVADSRIIHWDGSAWQVVSNPIENSGRLKSVAAVGPNDVWAVGDHTSSYQVVTEHWDGTGWSIVPNPAVGNYSFLDGVAAVDANDVWAVGEELDVAGGFDGTLTEHFTGNCP